MNMYVFIFSNENLTLKNMCFLPLNGQFKIKDIFKKNTFRLNKRNILYL